MFKWKLLFFIFLFYVINNIAIAWTFYSYGYESGVNDTKIEWDNSITKSNNNKVDILEEQNVEQNSAIDTGIVITRLRNGTF
jgi:mannose/fructose/N-acetylgalactosamine-specific phosphotransferase system component IID